MQHLSNLANERILFFEGAMGTEIQKYSLSDIDWRDKVGCSEILNFSKKEIIQEIHTSYLKAGVDILKTNTFGAIPWVLSEYDLQDATEEIACAGVQIAKEACKQHMQDYQRQCFVAFALGPGTKLPSLGHIDYDTMYDGYVRAIKGGMQAQPDIILFETAQDPLQLKAAIHAALDIAPHIPLMVSVTIETTGTMLIGTDIKTLAVILEPFPLFSLGINCGLGPDLAQTYLKELSEYSPFRISIHANAGLPENRGGQTYYPMNAEEFSRIEASFCDIAGVHFIGGCCGTTPLHLKKLIESVGNKTPKPHKKSTPKAIASLFSHIELEQKPAPLLIGERSNATGSKAFREILLANDYEKALSVGMEQVKKQAHALDVSVAFAGRDERADMLEVIHRYNQKIAIPLMPDSTQVATLEVALKCIGGRCMINSANLEDGIEKFDKIAALAKRFGAVLVCLCIDEEGMAKSFERKVQIAQRMLERALSVHHLREEDIIFDPLTFTIGSGDEEYFSAGEDTLKAIKELKRLYPKAGSTIGLSNISFGLGKEARIFLNSIFLYHAISNGLSSAIVNVAHIIPYSKMSNEDKKICENLIFNTQKTAEPLYTLIEHFSTQKSLAIQNSDDSHLSDKERIIKYLIDGDREAMFKLLPSAKESIPPEKIINEILISAMKIVGERFGNGEMQLPFVLQSAEVMKASVDYLNDFLPKSQKKQQVTLILGTVKGDVHDVGKNLVDIILSNNGFKVINIGIKADISKFIEAYKEHKADCIGMSGLLVKSTLIMKENLEALNKAGINCPVMLGGAALNREFVKEHCSPIYKGDVYYCRDAFDSMALMEMIESQDFSDKRLPSERQAKAELKLKQNKKIQPTESVENLRKKSLPLESELYTPPFWGRKILADGRNAQGEQGFLGISLEECCKYLNIDYLFKTRFGFKKKGMKKEEYIQLKQEKIMPVYNELIKLIKDEYLFSPIVIYGYYPCYAINEELRVQDNQREIVFSFERQTKEEYRCIADYFPKKDTAGGVVALSFVSSGLRFSQFEEKLHQQGDFQKYHLLYALETELAEALAEFVHMRVKEELGVRGCRYSFGYPACPDLSQNRHLFEILKPEEFGATLNAEFMMHPEGSTCAIIAPHTKAKYFAIHS
ncbi:methionine synthase [Helicobacter monodelphidis]|uniref:homocysteine S-methyltransferase family protein n=1 Tax=Helicobacter sp. 15-1451 TaxID=2004995 RepID=UPI000DCD9DD8|nr:homocysteine S-methyltransferase family protein [Helicobacter sp. 15-1451]RAX56612.1 methionine synthase [Helicobacter sp. 15-1451]